MKPGKIIEKFSVKGENGKNIAVTFRYPKQGDARALLEFVNKVRDQADFLGKRKHETLKSEKEILKRKIKQIKENKGFFVVAECNRKIIGSTHLRQDDFDSMQHVLHFGIALLEEFTGKGIGTALANCAISVAKRKRKWKIIVSCYFFRNKRSRALHAKLGFKKYGLLPKGMLLRNGSFDDEVKVYRKI